MRNQRIGTPTIPLAPGARINAPLLFGALPPRIAEGLAPLFSTPRQVPRGASIVEQGESEGRLYLVAAGAFKSWAVTAGGRECIVDIHGPGEVIGELSLGREPSPLTVSALEDSRALGAQAADLLGLVRSHPAASEQLVHALELRHRRLIRRLRDALLLDTDDLVLVSLQELAARHGVSESGGLLIDLPLTQEELAALVGRSRETVNRTLSRLAMQGRLRRRGRRFLLSHATAHHEVG